MPPAQRRAGLQRRLGTADAVVLGLASMLGAGVFVVFAPAAHAAGRWLLLAVVVAGLVAGCNAVSTADLAAASPESGGGYVYGRQRLGPWAGRLAGVAFLAGKTAAAAAAAGAFGAYVLPGDPTWLAVVVIVLATVVNVTGVRCTARVAWALVIGVLAVLAVVVVVGLAGPGADGAWPPLATQELAPLDEPAVPAGLLGAPTAAGLLGVPTAAGLVFFAFAGYARIATLGEEVRDPERTIRRAIPLALLIALVTYAAVAAAVLVCLGADRLATERAPLVAVVDTAGVPALGVLVRLGAVVAAVSVLLSVLVGVSRTALAMARRGELPRRLAVVGERGTPWRAEVAGAAAAVTVAVLAGPAAAIALSACCVLVYYGVVNAAALRMPAAQRRWPRWTSWIGLTLCAGLAALLPLTQVLVTAAVLMAGSALTALLGWQSARRARRAGGPE